MTTVDTSKELIVKVYKGKAAVGRMISLIDNCRQV